MTELKTAQGCKYLISGSRRLHAPCIYYLGLSQELTATEETLASLGCSVVYIVVDDWDNLLTPWPAKNLYAKDPDFQGKAPEFLRTLIDGLIPAIEKEEDLSPDRRAIAGYSLAGLFSVYAFANCDVFDCVVSMSGSFWYEGWVEYVSALDLDKHSRQAFFSLGDKEKKSREKILHSVQRNTEATIEVLERWGVDVQYRLVPGGHFDHVSDRILDGLSTAAKMMA